MPPLSRLISLEKFIKSKLYQAHLCIVPAEQSLSAPPTAGPDPTLPVVSVGRGRPAITNRCTHVRHIPHCRGRQSGEWVFQFLTCHPDLVSGGVQ
jgi:hypothetical protein